MKKYSYEKNDFPNRLIAETPVVYVLNTKGFEFVKIGFAKNLKQRMSNIQSGCPYEINLFTCAHAPNYREVEKYLHNYFSGFNSYGEWFSLDGDQLDCLQDFFLELNNSIRLAIRG